MSKGILMTKPDTKIIEFIDTFVNHTNPDVVINLFSNGYCYAFAQILKATFGGGKICWVAPYSHIIWLKDSIPYDINGVYQGESELFIPEEFLGEKINGFKHTPNYVDTTTEEDINNIIDQYLNYKKITTKGYL